MDTFSETLLVLVDARAKQRKGVVNGVPKTVCRCTGPRSEAGSYARLIDCVYHSALGLRVVKKKREARASDKEEERCSQLHHKTVH